MDDPILVHVDGLTDVGIRRANNEDAWWAGRPGGEHQQAVPGAAPLQFDATAGPVLLLVSDGVGGANAGEVASQMAVTLVAEALGAQPAPLRVKETAGAALLQAMGAAHQAILRRADEPGFDGMGATLSSLVFTADGHACWAQAGDSRIYLFRGGKLRQVSRDHSPVGRLRQSGRLTEAEARKHPARNQIDLSLGDRLNPFDPETGVEEAKDGDVFLVCSDGLSDGLWDSDLAKALAALKTPADLRPAVEGLVGAAKKASGRDNITAVVALLASANQPTRAHRLFG